MKPIAAMALFASLLLSLPVSASGPAFEDYPAHDPHRGPNAEVVLATPEDRMYRTILRAGSREPADFSGRYKVLTWGCGTGCQSGAVVDLSDGRVFHLPEMGSDFGYRLNSRLFAVHADFGDPGFRHEMYFEFTGEAFDYIAVVENVEVD